MLGLTLSALNRERCLRLKQGRAEFTARLFYFSKLLFPPIFANYEKVTPILKSECITIARP
ncbi:MAG TPA: hypothetical protein DIT25_01975 [Candidatus Moranbacteria bacterium]|nr:hypothetical protein [Candidatus Moranbacteria bacterium]